MSTSARVKHCIYGDNETWQQGRGRRGAPVENTLFVIGIVHERENCYCLVLGMDDPIFGDTSLGIISTLHLCIALWIIRADNLNHKIGAEPVGVLTTRIVGVAHEQQVRFTEFAFPNL